MNDRPNPDLEPDLAARIARIDQLERELVQKAAHILKANDALFHADFFMIGAVKRTLAQARGFRDLIASRNFPCAAAILRLQIDTAMRVNALFLVTDMDATCKAVLDGVRFNTLKDQDGVKMTDARLRSKLAEKEPWISPVYEQTSDFVHLSGRHFYSSIQKVEEDSRLAYFSISGEDPSRPDSAYFEVVDTFFAATKLVGTMALAYFNIRSGAIREGTPTPSE